MIILVEVVAENELHDLEVADHFPIIEIGGFENALDFAGVTMGKATLVRVLAQHVTVLDLEDSANAIGHGFMGSRMSRSVSLFASRFERNLYRAMQRRFSGIMEVVALVGCFVMVALPILFVFTLIMAITRKSKGWTAMTVVIGVIGVIALVVSLVYAGKQGAAKLAEMNQPRPFASADGLVEVTAPGTWIGQDFGNEVASLQIGNLIGNQYLLIISEEKRDFVPEFGIQEYAETISEQMKEVVESPIETELIPMEIGGLPAFRRELDGEIDGTKIAYLNTFIEGEQHFHQVLTWTLLEMKDRQFPLFRTTVASFRELSVPEE